MCFALTALGGKESRMVQSSNFQILLHNICVIIWGTLKTPQRLGCPKVQSRSLGIIPRYQNLKNSPR